MENKNYLKPPTSKHSFRPPPKPKITTHFHQTPNFFSKFWGANFCHTFMNLCRVKMLFFLGGEISGLVWIDSPHQRFAIFKVSADIWEFSTRVLQGGPALRYKWPNGTKFTLLIGVSCTPCITILWVFPPPKEKKTIK